MHTFSTDLQHTCIFTLHPRIFFIKVSLKEGLFTEYVASTNDICDRLGVGREFLVGKFHNDSPEEHKEDAVHFAASSVEQISLVETHDLKISTHELHSVPADPREDLMMQTNPFNIEHLLCYIYRFLEMCDEIPHVCFSIIFFL